MQHGVGPPSVMVLILIPALRSFLSIVLMLAAQKTISYGNRGLHSPSPSDSI